MKNVLKVLFVDSTHARLPEMLKHAGFDVDYNPGKITPDNIKGIIQNYDGLIIRSKIKIDKTIIDVTNKLKFIGRVGAGLENIDVEYAEQKGIKC